MGQFGLRSQDRSAGRGPTGPWCWRRRAWRSFGPRRYSVPAKLAQPIWWCMYVSPDCKQSGATCTARPAGDGYPCLPGLGRATPPANRSPQALARFRRVRRVGPYPPSPRHRAKQPAQCARGLVRPALQAGRAPRRPASPPGSATHSKRRRGRPGQATGSGLRTTALLSAPLWLRAFLLAGMIVRKRLARDTAPRAKPHRLPPAKAPWAPAIRCDGRWQDYRMGGRGGEKRGGGFWG